MQTGRKWLRRTRKLVLWGGALALAALLAINVLLNLPPIKSRAEGILAGRFGGPVEIGLVTYFPPSALRAGGVKLGDPDAPAVTMNVSASLRPWKTLTGWGERRELVFGDIRCEQVRLTVVLPAESQQPASAGTTPVEVLSLGDLEPNSRTPSLSESVPGEGSAVPDQVVEAKPVPAAPPSSEPSTTAPSGPPPPTVVAKPTPKPAKRPVSLVYNEIALSGGRIEIEDADSGQIVASVEGVELSIAPSEEEGVILAGQIGLGEVRLLDQTVADRGSARLSVQRQGFDVTEIELPTAGGPLTGRAIVGAAAGSPFQLELRGESMDVSALLAEASRGESWVAGGTAELRMRMRGLVSQPGAVRARLQVVATDLAIGALAETGRASAAIDVVGGQVLLSEARAQLGGKLLKAVGVVGRDGLLRVNARLYTAGDLHLGFARRAAVLRDDAPPLSFAALEGTDWHYLDFLVSGGIRDPRADLWRDGTWSPLPELVESLLNEPVMPTIPGELAPVSN